MFKRMSRPRKDLENLYFPDAFYGRGTYNCRSAVYTTGQLIFVAPVASHEYTVSVPKMGIRAARLWWIPVVLGVVFLATAVVDVFDPTAATPNPYNKLELFAETPVPRTVKSVLHIALGVFGLSTLVVLEFAYRSTDVPRLLTSPLRLIVFGWAAAGFVVAALDGARALDLLPDLAHYYFDRGGAQRDAAALLSHSLLLDRYSFVLASGAAAWALRFSIDLLAAGRADRRWGVVGLGFAASLLLQVASVLLDPGGLLDAVLARITTVVVSPIWFIGMGTRIRRRNDAASKQA